jgi:hypothetical protein
MVADAPMPCASTIGYLVLQVGELLPPAKSMEGAKTANAVIMIAIFLNIFNSSSKTLINLYL